MSQRRPPPTIFDGHLSLTHMNVSLNHMTVLELHRQNPSLELAPILRVIKYMGFDSNALSDAEVEKILLLYRQFESDPELVVGTDAVARLTEMEPERVTEVLAKHRHEIPFLGTTAHPMVPTTAIGMIRAVAAGEDPLTTKEEPLFTLTEMAEQTDISLASLSKYVKDHPDRVPSKLVGKMRKFPRAAIAVFQQIKSENLGRRGNGHDRGERQKAAVSRRYAAKFAELEEQLEAAVEVSKELSRTLNRLTNQVRRARSSAESGSRIAESQPKRARRSGGHRPDTIVAACKTVLAGAQGPMRVADITERVIAMGTPIKAKNPNVTVSSILSSYDDFGRVRRGYYELLKRDESAVEASPAVEATRGGDEVAPTEGAEAPVPETETTLESAAPQQPAEPAPEDVLAGLQAAADMEDRSKRVEDRRERAPKLDIEPLGATS